MYEFSSLIRLKLSDADCSSLHIMNAFADSPSPGDSNQTVDIGGLTLPSLDTVHCNDLEAISYSIPAVPLKHNHRVYNSTEIFDSIRYHRVYNSTEMARKNERTTICLPRKRHDSLSKLRERNPRAVGNRKTSYKKRAHHNQTEERKYNVSGWKQCDARWGRI